MIWNDKEIDYLKKIYKSCEELNHLYDNYYIKYKSIAMKFRLPAIVIGGVASAISFGTAQFPFVMQGYISIIVGSTSLFIAILNTIEAYLELNKTMAQSLTTSQTFKKLADDVQCELSIPVEDRETAGIFFLRSIYTRYQQTLNIAPHLEMDEMVRKAIKDSIQFEIDINNDKPNAIIDISNNDISNNKINIVIGIDDNFPGERYIKYRISKEAPEIPIMNSLDYAVLTMVKKIYNE